MNTYSNGGVESEKALHTKRCAQVNITINEVKRKEHTKIPIFPYENAKEKLAHLCVCSYERVIKNHNNNNKKKKNKNNNSQTLAVNKYIHVFHNKT